jgi:alpha-L-rhamnosidase
MKNLLPNSKCVWPKEFQEVWNQLMGFKCEINLNEDKKDIRLALTAGDAYRIWCNNQFVGYGPARTAKGYARVDEWLLDSYLNEGINHLAIEVISHNIDSYVYPYQKPFFIAEVKQNQKCIASSPSDFKAFLLDSHIQKVARFSKQRAFAEAYHLKENCHEWKMSTPSEPAIPLEEVECPKLLNRHVAYGEYEIIHPNKIVDSGNIEIVIPSKPSNPGGQREVGTRYLGYTNEEQSVDMAKELDSFSCISDNQNKGTYQPDYSYKIASSSFLKFDFIKVNVGFIRIKITCTKQNRIYLSFDEINERPANNKFALGISAIYLNLEPGEHTFESIEPYSCRFLNCISLDSTIEISDINIRELAHPSVDEAQYQNENQELNAIFKAGIQTFRTNSLDLFTDCPSRERGGYPCDSWFTAQAERTLTGNNLVERNFLENYFLNSEFNNIPKGMFPHCYPSEQYGKSHYIPNWAMWLVIQLCDYCIRYNDEELKKLAEAKVAALINFFNPYLNEFNLLENLDSWVFVEWSQANEYTQGVNFPSNMLYSRCLELAGRLYEEKQWDELSSSMKSSILEYSFNGQYFADQSLRVDGKLVRTDFHSESCQYHAFYFGITDTSQHNELWVKLKNDWGPRRGLKLLFNRDKKAYEFVYENGAQPKEDDKDLVPACLLYGLMLRFELLIDAGEKEIVEKDILNVFGKMAQISGSLWEHGESQSSLNHGFASAACRYLIDADKIVL